ncbi:hypothetical protein OL548_04440 [Lysinibacillus sp. MHQ-1]|nr:hypothetical protein OL548_04440 [Lysinibacillus sp. MHQ-1]
MLPDLGEDNMQQLTFIEYAEKRLGRQFQLEYPYEQLEDLLTEKDEAQYLTKLNSISFKASLAYKQLIDQYVSYLSNKGLLFKKYCFSWGTNYYCTGNYGILLFFPILHVDTKSPTISEGMVITAINQN